MRLVLRHEGGTSYWIAPRHQALHGLVHVYETVLGDVRVRTEHGWNAVYPQERFGDVPVETVARRVASAVLFDMLHWGGRVMRRWTDDGGLRAGEFPYMLFRITLSGLFDPATVPSPMPGGMAAVSQGKITSLQWFVNPLMLERARQTRQAVVFFWEHAGDA